MAQVAAEYHVSKSWLYELLARYRAEGETAFEARSRRPQHSPTATAQPTVELIVQLRKTLTEAGHDAGPATLAWHLQTPPPADGVGSDSGTGADPARLDHPGAEETTRRLPTSASKPPCPTRPGSPTSPTTASPTAPTWRSSPGSMTTPATCCTAQPTDRSPPPIVLATFRATAATYGIPASTLTDNGMVYTVRFATGRGGRTGLEAELARLHITQKNSRPNHPTTCGKVERFQQTLKKWLRAQPHQPATIDRAADPDRPVHRRLQPPAARTAHCRTAPPRPPPTAARPKAAPSSTRTGDTPRPRPHRPHRLRRQTHPARQRPPAPHRHGPNPRPNPRPAYSSTTSHVRIIDAATGELLRELTIEPRPRLPTHRQKPPDPPQTQRARTPETGVRHVRYLSRDHRVRPKGFEPLTS